MFINQIDELINTIIDNFHEYIIKNNFFKKLSSTVNFIRYQNDIINNIKIFIDSINKKNILNIIKQNYFDLFIDYIKKYCAMYLYLGIAYYFKGTKEMFVTNIIECSRLQNNINYNMDNFYNSDNNAKIINYYIDIKNILSLVELKTLDKIKIILFNNILKYDSTIKLFNEIGEDIFINEFMIEDNFFNIIKTIIIKLIYFKEDKNDLLNLLHQQEIEDAEYKYIEIIVSNNKKIVDFDFIEKFLNMNKLSIKLAQEIYDYISETFDNNDYILMEMQDFINYLFVNKIIIPITEEFVRYHKETEKYNPNTIVNSTNINLRDATQIKYIVYKINNIINYYSPLISPKLKLETKNLFYKQFENRFATLYNNDLEIKIIQKLEISKQTTDYELLIDLQTFRKYAYINFKNFSKDGTKIRTNSPVSCIRYCNITDKSKKLIETRICNENIDINIIGLAFNSTKKIIDFVYNTDLINTRIDANSNGFTDFLNNIILKKNKKIYYWLFDNNKDKPKSDTYINYNINDVQNNIKLMINEIYKYYINLIKNKFFNYLDSNNNFYIWKLNHILNKYRNFFNIFQNIKNEIMQFVIFEKIKHINIFQENYFNIYDIKKEFDVIKLPTVKIKEKKKINILNLSESAEKIIQLQNDMKYIKCYHLIKWKKILALSKKTEEFSQSIFDFAKQYNLINNDGLYVCKSCGELLNIEKYIVTGTYIDELDTFLTTTVGVNQNLEDINSYAKYGRTIKNIDKNIEKIGYNTSNIIYIGNDSIVKLRRRLMIKDIIDFILIHSEWGKKQKKNRKDEYNSKYGIDKDLSNLFFFELKDDIFLTSSIDTDQYKIFKYNNIIVYIILFIILELNQGQIIFFKNDKIFNYLLFDKIKDSIFNNLFIRLNQKEKISLNKLPLLSYIIFYYSGIVIYHKIWLFQESKINSDKNKLINIIGLQKIFVHTLIDLINTIIEANFETNKNYLYETINNKIHNKIFTLFNNNSLLEQLNTNIINYNKIKDNKIEFIDINNIYVPFFIEPKIYCLQAKQPIIQIQIKKNLNNINNLTNCSNGEFHKWIFQSQTNDLICSICSNSYRELIKISSPDSNITYLDKLNFNYLNRMALKYCISGNLHEFEKNSSICFKCNKNINSDKFNDKELFQLEINLEQINNEIALINMNKIRKIQKKKDIKNNKINNFINKLKTKFNKNRLELYLNKFINNLISRLGNKVKIDNDFVYLNETFIIINHNFYGIKINSIEKPISFFIIDENNNFFKKDIIYYKDKINNVFVYYDIITLQYLGYSEIYNTNIINTKNYALLEINYSIKDCILLFGYDNEYINLNHFDKNYSKNNTNINDIIIQIIRNRINNLKQILMKIKTIIYSIKNKYIADKIQNQIIIEYSKKISSINLQNSKNKKSVFKNSKYIINNININYDINNHDYIINNNYLNFKYLNSLDNSDMYIIFYIIFHFNRILNYSNNNDQDIAFLLVKIIKYIFNLYYRSYSNINIRKFDYLLINDPPYVNDILKVVGMYEELLTVEEINDENKKEEVYNIQEEFDALDINDYEVDEEFDGQIENIGE
jgi:hypothetical protein